MNSYVTLNNKKYATLSSNWVPISTVPATVRVTLDGNLDVTYGPGTIKEWQGTFLIPVTPETGYGSMDDFQACIEARAELTFQDHYATHTYGIHMISSQGAKQRSMVPMWDAVSNEWRVDVRLVIGRLIL